MVKKPSKQRAEGMIRRRGSSFQAIVYAGIDPVSGKQLYLRGSSPDERAAERMLRRFLVEVAEQRHARTRASLRTTIESWLDTNELEESTRENYVWLIAKHIYPAIGEQPIGKVTAHVLERFYAELRRCSSRCDGRPFVEHRVDGDARLPDHPAQAPSGPPTRGWLPAP